MFLTDLGSQIFDLDHAFRITDIAVKLQELFRDHREWAALDADDGLVQIRIDPCDGFGNEPLWELLFRHHTDAAGACGMSALSLHRLSSHDVEDLRGEIHPPADPFHLYHAYHRSALGRG